MAENRLFAPNIGRALGVMALFAMLLGGFGGRAATAQVTSRYFPETNHTVYDPFLAYWTSNGGLAQQGYPLNDQTPEVNLTDGKTYITQYFERSRFEYHPEQTDPANRVLLGLIGREALQAKYPKGLPAVQPIVVPGNGSRFFSETGHTVTGLFLSYWNDHGGLRQEGLPLTEAFTETNDADGKQYLTQYFERARFEYHPEQSNPQYQVLLGLVGKEIFLRKHTGNIPSPTPKPAGCQFDVYQVFQYAISNNPGLKDQLGCALDGGAGAEKDVDGGLQNFRYGKIIIISPSTGATYGYGLYPNGAYKRVETTRVPDKPSTNPKDPGPHFSDAAGSLGDLGDATSAEDFGDGAVQTFQKGVLIYIGSQTQLVYAIFPNNAPTGTWVQYHSRP